MVGKDVIKGVKSSFISDVLDKRSVQICYLAYRAKDRDININQFNNVYELIDGCVTDRVIKRGVLHALEYRYDKDNKFNELKETIISIMNNCSLDEIAKHIIYCIDMQSLNSSIYGDATEFIHKLEMRILDVNEGESFANLRSCDSELMNLIDVNCSYHSYEDEWFGVSNLIIKAELSGVTIDAEVMNAFNIDITFDKCLMELTPNIKCFDEYDEPIYDYVEDLFYDCDHEGVVANWAYVKKLSELIEDDGKAVVVLPDDAFHSQSDRFIRQQLAEAGLIEAIFSMPLYRYHYEFEYTNLIVLSKNNTGINFIDVTDLGTNNDEGIREFDDSDVAEAMRRYSSENEFTQFVSNEDIRDAKYSIVPATYRVGYDIENGVRLSDLCVDIFDCTSITRDVFMEVRKSHPDIHPIYIEEIEIDGVVLTDNEFKLDDNTHVYGCANNGDVIVGNDTSREAVQLKCDADSNYMISRDIYAIKVDTNKANPAYVCMMLNSEFVGEQIGDWLVCTDLDEIPLYVYKNLVIPVVSRDIQDEMAKKYIDISKSIVEHRYAIEDNYLEIEDMVNKTFR